MDRISFHLSLLSLCAFMEKSQSRNIVFIVSGVAGEELNPLPIDLHFEWASCRNGFLAGRDNIIFHGGLVKEQTESVSATIISYFPKRAKEGRKDICTLDCADNTELCRCTREDERYIFFAVNVTARMEMSQARVIARRPNNESMSSFAGFTLPKVYEPVEMSIAFHGEMFDADMTNCTLKLYGNIWNEKLNLGFCFTGLSLRHNIFFTSNGVDLSSNTVENCAFLRWEPGVVGKTLEIHYVEDTGCSRNESVSCLIYRYDTLDLQQAMSRSKPSGFKTPHCNLLLAWSIALCIMIFW